MRSTLHVLLWCAPALMCINHTARAAEPVAANKPRITLIMDDLGYARKAGQRVIALPGPVVVAVLPHTPHGVKLAELAAASGKEVLLHQPLQADIENEDSQSGIEPGRIDLDTTRLKFAKTLAANVASVPNLIGINTHKGSLLTRHPGHMRWLMEEVVSRDLLFVDSYTTHLSVALSIANEFDVPAARRDVFLDSSRNPPAIAREFARLKRLARERGSAIGIGHPYPETLALLEVELPKLEKEGFVLLGLRDLLEERKLSSLISARPAPSSRRSTVDAVPAVNALRPPDTAGMQR